MTDDAESNIVYRRSYIVYRGSYIDPRFTIHDKR